MFRIGDWVIHGLSFDYVKAARACAGSGKKEDDPSPTTINTRDTGHVTLRFKCVSIQDETVLCGN